MTRAEDGATLVTRTGQIVERRLGGQSKQARITPVLETDAGDVVIHVLGDNPFAPALLAQWMGQRVEVTGTWRGNTLRVAPSEIRALPEETNSADHEADPARGELGDAPASPEVMESGEEMASRLSPDTET